MSPFRFVVSICLFVFFSSVGGHAQQYTRKEAEVVMGGPLHDIISCAGGDHILITYPMREDKHGVNIAITRFDPQLALLFNNQLKELPGSHYSGALYSGNRFFLFCNDKEGVVSRYEIDDKTGQIKGRPLSLYSLNGKELNGKIQNALFFAGSSRNKNFHYCLVKDLGGKESGMTFHGVVLDNKMDVTAHFSFTTPEEKEEYNDLQVVLSDKGILTLVYSVSAKTKRDEYSPYKYTLLQVDEKGKISATPLSGLPTGNIPQLSFVIQEDEITFSGLLAREKGKYASVVVGGRFDPGTKKITDIQQTEITGLLSNSPTFIKKAGGKGLPFALFNRSLWLPDGSRVIIWEEQCVYDYGGYVGGIFTTPNLTGAANLWYYNVYALKLDRHNTPVWMNIVGRNQLEQDLNLRMGLSSVLDDRGIVHIFFYDKKRNTQVYDDKADYVGINREFKKTAGLACVSISPDGKMTKQFVGENADYEFQLMPQFSLSGEGNQLNFMAIKAGRGFSGSQVLNNSEYHFGAISIKN